MGNSGQPSRPERARRFQPALPTRLIVVAFAAAIFLGLHHQPAVSDGRCGRRAGADRAQYAGLGRLGDGAAERRRVSRKIAADVLDDGGVVWFSVCTTGPRGFRWRCRAVLLCWLTCRDWARGRSRQRAGLYAGLALATCIGLWLFTRIQIPDVMLTLTITLALWAFLRALDDEERSPGLWCAVMAAAIGTGLLLKGLIAARVPGGGGAAYLGVHRQLWRERDVAAAAAISRVSLIALAIAAPWHVLATLRNPPYFDFTMQSEPGQYHGFFWFYFFNEHVFRFLNMRYPRDYNTVPRPVFWLFHLLWLFPWSVFLPGGVKLQYRPVGPGRAHATARACAGPDSCWYSSRFRRRRNTTRCPAIRRWRC